MAGLGAIISGDRKVEQLFDAFPNSLRPELREVISDEIAQLAARVRAAVPRKTGRLQSEIATALQERDSRISGIVHLTGEYAKAGALEYGAHRTITIHAHSERLDHIWHRLFGMTVEVPTYERHQNLEAERFLRGTFAELQAQITQRLQQVVDEAVRET
jgi:hypothetical protein